MKIYYVFSFTLIVILSLSVNTSQANPLSGGVLFNLSLEELLNIEITGATLQSSTLKNVPAAVTVITREQIDLYGFTMLIHYS